MRALVGELGKNEIYADTFSPEGLAWAGAHMPDIGSAIAERTAVTYTAGLPAVAPDMVREHARRASLKSSVFAVALTMGELPDTERLVRFGQAVNGMYIPNDLVDGGGQTADTAIAAIDSLLGTQSERSPARLVDPPVLALLRAITQTEDHITAIARPEDRRFVLERIYQKVLGNEVRMQRFSRAYVAAQTERTKQAFLAWQGDTIAHASTESAGAPSITSGLYAMYRSQDPALPPLAEVYNNAEITAFDLVLNAVARLWDDIGDFRKDGRGLNGQGPDKDKFMLNVFGQPAPALIHGYLDLAAVQGDRREQLYHDIAHFSGNTAAYKERIVRALVVHLREYTAGITAETRDRFARYVTMGRRVAEIALVNAKGDDLLDAMSAT